MRLYAEKRPKYGNKRVIVDGFSFASKHEARRYGQLKIQQKVGMISDLKLQPRFDFVVEGQRICAYIADFSYVRDGMEVVEDAKSPPTRKKPEYRIKVKLLKALYPKVSFIEIV